MFLTLPEIERAAKSGELHVETQSLRNSFSGLGVNLTIGCVAAFEIGGTFDAERATWLDHIELAPGSAALVITRELIATGPRIAGLLLTKGSVSREGKEIIGGTSVDPNYGGPLRFIVLNRGKRPIAVRADQPIVTIAFTRLSRDCADEKKDATDVYAPVISSRRAYELWKSRVVPRLSHDHKDHYQRLDWVLRGEKGLWVAAKKWGAPRVLFLVPGLGITGLVSTFVWQQTGQFSNVVAAVACGVSILALFERGSRP